MWTSAQLGIRHGTTSAPDRNGAGVAFPSGMTRGSEGLTHELTPMSGTTDAICVRGDRAEGDGSRDGIPPRGSWPAPQAQLHVSRGFRNGGAPHFILTLPTRAPHAKRVPRRAPRVQPPVGPQLPFSDIQRITHTLRFSPSRCISRRGYLESGFLTSAQKSSGACRTSRASMEEMRRWSMTA